MWSIFHLYFIWKTKESPSKKAEKGKNFPPPWYSYFFLSLCVSQSPLQCSLLSHLTRGTTLCTYVPLYIKYHMAAVYRYIQKPTNILFTDISTIVSNHHFIYLQANIVIRAGKSGGIGKWNWVLKWKINKSTKTVTVQGAMLKLCRCSASFVLLIAINWLVIHIC